MTHNHRVSLDLSGEWYVYLDPEDQGMESRWSDRLPEHPSGCMSLPGCLQENGFGEPPHLETEWVGSQFDSSFYEDSRYEVFRREESFKFPYWLQPEWRYIGPAWFVRTVTIPEDWTGSRVVLHMERPHWGTHAWIDGVALGACDTLSVPHEYDLGESGTPGVHRISVRVDNRLLYEVGPNAHSVSDHTQGNWNGIVGQIRLEAMSPVYIDGVDVYPNTSRRTALIQAQIANVSGERRSLRTGVTCSRSRRGEGVSAGSVADNSTEVSVGPEGAVVHLEVQLDESVALWDEFTPGLVDITVELREDDAERPITDSRTIRTGIRSVGVAGDRITLNGSEVSLRGTLECAVFPTTGYPPTDHNSWREIFRRARAFGLNHLRFHSWCPPEAAFNVADEEGFYLQVECPVWANQGASVGTDVRFDRWLFKESDRIVRRYGNHPCFIMFASGNEPAGRIEEFLGQWVEYWKQRDGRRLYTSGAGWPAIPENDYHNVPDPRIQQWGEELSSRINAKPPETETDYTDTCARFSGPVVSHEIGQWCVFPNFEEIPKYTGYLKPRNFEIFREFLEANGMGHQAQAFLHASGRLQALCYREEIEAALRTRNQSGFHLLGLTDFPGQGTALVGVLDAFWQEKGYCTAEEFRQSCGPTVVLARFPKRTYRVGEALRVPIEISHYGASAISSARGEWRVVSGGGEVVRSGSVGNGVWVERGLKRIGEITTRLNIPETPGRYELQVSLSEPDVTNRWSFWCFPDEVEMPATDVTITDDLDDNTVELLERGGAVLLLATPESVRTDVAIGFSPVFWNTAWTEGQAPHTLGLLCDPDHPALARFPTAYHSDWQWWELVHGSAAMVMDELPHTVTPIVQPIDTWFRSHRLALLFEVRIGAGKLMVASMDLSSDLGHRIVARQLCSSILHYMGGSQFSPSVTLTVGEITGLFQGGGDA